MKQKVNMNWIKEKEKKKREKKENNCESDER